MYGRIHNGVEDTDSDEVRERAPAFENYSFSDAGASTEVKVDVDIAPEFEDDMNRIGPKALARLEDICESAPSSAKA